ncbi:MAG: hypothetical protein J3K34DRAFT_410792, partial [Monoraphidium minutum]
NTSPSSPPQPAASRACASSTAFLDCPGLLSGRGQKSTTVMSVPVSREPAAAAAVALARALCGCTRMCTAPPWPLLHAAPAAAATCCTTVTTSATLHRQARPASGWSPVPQICRACSPPCTVWGRGGGCGEGGARGGCKSLLGCSDSYHTSQLDAPYRCLGVRLTFMQLNGVSGLVRSASTTESAARAPASEERTAAAKTGPKRCFLGGGRTPSAAPPQLAGVGSFATAVWPTRAALLPSLPLLRSGASAPAAGGGGAAPGAAGGGRGGE